MTSADLFLRSVRDVFARNREGDWAQIGLLLGGAVVVSIAVSLVIGRQRSRREIARRIDAVTVRAGLIRSDLDYLGRIAAAADVSLLDVMTRLPAFERATALALVSQTEVLRPLPGSVFERIRRLRKALSYSPLPAHHWLLSTRELILGDLVSAGNATGKVVEVSEASFAVDLPVTAIPAVGGFANLAIARADDSRYLPRARVLAAEPVARPAAESGIGSPFRRVFFAHDEKPERQQNREHVRVRMHGIVTVRMVDLVRKPSRTTGGLEAARAEASLSDDPPEPISGTLVDVSAGGLAMDVPAPAAGPLRRGTRIRCSFAVGDDATFNDVAALIVAAGAGPRSGTQHLRLSFVALADVERDRLASAVARQQRPPAADGALAGTGQLPT
jgi:hypothetical protein